jgi:predicted nuclease with RNAse H fold
MRTAGIDIASKDTTTAVCWIEWTDSGATVDDQSPDVVDDDEIRRCVQSADKAGIDIPLGWPTAFVEAITRHHRHEAWQATDVNALRLRATDRWVTARARRPNGPDKPGLYPLSVSTNLIGVPALRIAAALAPFDRTGSGTIVEVYPKAALYVWGLAFDGYKGNGAAERAARDNLVSDLRRRIPWLRASEDVWERCRRSDDHLDALVCSLVARAKACGLCDESFQRSSGEAQSEGWIALPLPGSLVRLGTSSQT